MKFTSSDAAVVTELVTNAGPVQCFLTEPAYVLAERRLRASCLALRSAL